MECWKTKEGEQKKTQFYSVHFFILKGILSILQSESNPFIGLYELRQGI